MREILKTCWVNTVAAEAYLNIDFPTKNDGWDFLLEIRESWIISFVENVHLCISLREMQKMPCRDAKKWQKKFASRNETCGWLIKGGKSFLAMYHFRIKSDKKPNGTKISAVKHVEYINREGKFFSPEQWQQKK